MNRSRMILSALTALVLTGCASPGIAFQPKAGADLAADRAQCEAVAVGLNPDAARSYTSDRYGAAAAMAARLDGQSVKGGTVNRTRDAVLVDCMTRKGYVQKQ